MTISQTDLPDDWQIVDASRARSLEEELQREVSPVHRLNGVPMQAVAVRASNDDALFQHAGEADQWSDVHLTWSGQQEQRDWPSVEFTGTFAEFREAFTSPV